MDHSAISLTHPEASSQAAASQADQRMIRLVDLCKRLGRKQVLDGAHLDITKGETHVVLGRSGEGKSVLLKHIIGLMQPDRGEVWIDGENVTGKSDRDLYPVRKKIGMLFQNAALFDSMTVLHNVGFSLYEEKVESEEEIRKRVQETLEMVRLGDVLEKMPSELSGGMRKRVGLARAIILRPKIILYDEPTTGLDPVTSDAINELIISLSKQLQATSVVITHDMTSAFKIADRFSFLFKGEFIFTGSKDDILNTDDPIIQQFIQGKSEGPLSEVGT